MTRPERAPVNLALPALVTVLTAAAVGFVTLQGPAASDDVEDVVGPAARGVVVDERGDRISGAVISAGDTIVRSDKRGEYALPTAAPVLGSVSAAGHLSRTALLTPAAPTTVVVASDPDRTVSLRFGGDVMMGRRYFESRGSQYASLSDSSTAEDHAAVLAGVKPFLDDADLAVVNLETPLLQDPHIEEDGKRRKDVHATKGLVLASSTTLAQGLVLAGVDVVSLGNNHVYDGLEAGLASTVEALDAAGVVHFGAGRNTDEAWKPAVVNRKGQDIAFIGCTTVDGRQSGLPYVASRTKPGAAECSPGRLAHEIRTVRGEVDAVVVMIHGGTEYRRSQTAEVRALAEAAHGAGANLVVGSHPHVLGGFVADGGQVFAESMGNLTFDQDLWATFPSALLRVDLRGGAPVATSADPVVVDHYRPRPATGGVADASARILAGWVPGAGRLTGGGAAIGAAAGQDGAAQLVGLSTGSVRRISPGWWYSGREDGGVDARVGTDLLFGTGDFEQMALGAEPGSAPLWSVGKYAEVAPEAACGPAAVAPEPGEEAAGAWGLQLARTPLSEQDAYASPRHRTPVVQTHKMSVLASLRQASEGARLEVRWFDAMEGKSVDESVLDLPEGSWPADGCARIRFDVVVPKGVKAAQVFVRLKPPDGGQRLRLLALDDIAFVDWAPKSRTGRRYDVVEAVEDGKVAFRTDMPLPQRGQFHEPLLP